MSVTIDHEPLTAEEMGWTTVGQVLSHIQKDNRLVVQVLLDGREPDMDRVGALRQSLLTGHTLYIETAEPSEMAREVLDEAETQLADADRLKSDACDLLQRNQPSDAMQKLSGCFTRWHHAQDAVLKTAQLLRVDLNTLRLGATPLSTGLGALAEQLRRIKSSLEMRDYVTLSDILSYEIDEAATPWRLTIDLLRGQAQPA
jgi:hypothetical protein